MNRILRRWSAGILLPLLFLLTIPSNAQGKKEIENLEFTSMDGRKVRMRDFSGKLVLIDCWASWCAPCLKELPHIKEMYEKYKGQGLEVIGISLDEEEAKGRVANILKKNGVTWPQRFEGTGFNNDSFRTDYNIESLPTVMLVDQHGQFVDRKVRGERLEELIKKHLNL